MKDLILEAIFAELIEEPFKFDTMELHKSFFSIFENHLAHSETDPMVDLICEHLFEYQKIAFKVGFETALKMVVQL